MPPVWVSWCGEHWEDAEGGEFESWRGTSVSEGTAPRVAKPERQIAVLVAFSVPVCAPDKIPLAKNSICFSC